MVVIRTRDFGHGNSGLLCASRRTDGKASLLPISHPVKIIAASHMANAYNLNKVLHRSCLMETPTTSIQPSSGNFVVKRGLGRWRGRRRFGMGGCPMKHRCFIQSSPGGLLWANDCVTI